MKVEIKEVESQRTVQAFDNVTSVEQGICNMIMLRMNDRYVLHPTCLNEYFEVTDKAI